MFLPWCQNYLELCFFVIIYLEDIADFYHGLGNLKRDLKKSTLRDAVMSACKCLHYLLLLSILYFWADLKLLLPTFPHFEQYIVYNYLLSLKVKFFLNDQAFWLILNKSVTDIRFLLFGVYTQYKTYPHSFYFPTLRLLYREMRYCTSANIKRMLICL